MSKGERERQDAIDGYCKDCVLRREDVRSEDCDEDWCAFYPFTPYRDGDR